MSILATYAELRHHFSEIARTTSVALTYTAGPPGIISRASGSFITDGFIAAQSVDVANTASNDGRYTVGSVAALAITLSADDTLIAEGPVTSSLTGAFYENDGAEQWPVANVRAGGFSSTWNLQPRPISIFPAELTVNAFADDISAGTSYTWYIRQRTDDSTLQWLSAFHPDADKTGTIGISLTAKATTDLGVADLTKLTTEQQVRVLRDVTIFCKRDSDGAIQLVDLLQLSHAVTE